MKGLILGLTFSLLVPFVLSNDSDIAVNEGRGLFPWYFPWLPPFRGVDLGANFNIVKSANDAGYFLTRDTIAFIITTLGWLVFHALIWRGEVTSISQLVFPFNIVALLFGGPNSRAGKEDPEDRLFLQSSKDQVSLNGLINFYTNPNTATRNLILAGGFAFFAYLLWILPTFFWTGTPLPENDTKDPNDRTSRIAHIINYVRSGSGAVAIYNRLMCPQCVVTNISINLLGLLGRYLFWGTITRLPDLPNFGVPRFSGRSISEDRLLIQDIIDEAIDEFLDSVENRVGKIVKDLEISEKKKR